MTLERRQRSAPVPSLEIEVAAALPDPVRKNPCNGFQTAGLEQPLTVAVGIVPLLQQLLPCLRTARVGQRVHKVGLQAVTVPQQPATATAAQ